MGAKLFFVCWMVMSTGYQGHNNEAYTLEEARTVVEFSTNMGDGIIYWICDKDDPAWKKSGKLAMTSEMLKALPKGYTVEHNLVTGMYQWCKPEPVMPDGKWCSGGRYTTLGTAIESARGFAEIKEQMDRGKNHWKEVK